MMFAAFCPALNFSFRISSYSFLYQIFHDSNFRQEKFAPFRFFLIVKHNEKVGYWFRQKKTRKHDEEQGREIPLAGQTGFGGGGGFGNR